VNKWPHLQKVCFFTLTAAKIDDYTNTAVIKHTPRLVLEKSSSDLIIRTMSSTASASKPRATKKAAVAAPAAAVAAPVVAAPVVAAPAPVVAAPAPVATTVVAATEEVNIVSEFNQILEQVNTLRTQFSTVFSAVKKFEKQLPRELKKASKGRRRRAAVVEGEAPKPKKDTVFTKPTPISDALCTFLSVPKGTLLSRSEVTTRVCKYAKDNQLMVKQVIKTDTAAGAPLRKLLALTEADELKILNLQRYLKPHYIKPATTA